MGFIMGLIGMKLVTVKLGVEYANQIDVKYQWSNEHLGIVINPFIQDISDFISLDPTDSVISAYKVYNYMQYDKVDA